MRGGLSNRRTQALGFANAAQVPSSRRPFSCIVEVQYVVLAVGILLLLLYISSLQNDIALAYQAPSPGGSDAQHSLETRYIMQLGYSGIL